MTYRLRFDGVNDVVSHAGSFVPNAGNTDYTIRVKFILNSLPASGLAALVGTGSSSTSSGLIVNSAGNLRVYTAGTNRYGTTGSLSVGVLYDITLTHAAAGNWTIVDNITSTTLGSGTFTTSTVFASLNRFGRSSTASTTYLDADVELITLTAAGFDHTWLAFLSQKGSSTLRSLAGTFDGSLSGFPTDNTQWIQDNSGYKLLVDSSQGSTAAIEIPSVTGNPSQSWETTVCFNLSSLAESVILLGGDGTGNTRALYVTTSGSLVWGTVGINTSAGVISTNTKYWLKASSEVDGTKTLSLSADGFTYADQGTANYTAANMAWNRVFTALDGAAQPGVLHYIHTARTGYSDLFYEDSTNGTGTTWPSFLGTRSLTLTNFAGATNSWWVSNIPAGGGGVLKHYNGTVYVEKPLKYHNGTTWVTKPLKYHNGTGWV
jgi:hypothetical protein